MPFKRLLVYNRIYSILYQNGVILSQKEELIYLTLRQLNENYSQSPYNFRLEDPEIKTLNANATEINIVWQFKVELKPGEYITDPLNSSKTIIVSYNKKTNELFCCIYFREIHSSHLAIMADAESRISLFKFKIFNRSYRAFWRLRRRMLRDKLDSDYLDYLRKLNKVFPSTHEQDLFK
jgi:hypothetical protein